MRAFLLACLSGLLLGLSLPPNPYGGLEWIALAPLFLAARRTRPLFAAGLGAVSILVASPMIVYPLQTPEEWGNAGGGCAVFALLLVWTCAFAASSQTSSPVRWSFTVAGAGVVAEWIAHAGFPVYMAMGQWRNPAIMPVASWVGIWGVSFLLYGVNAALATGLDHLGRDKRLSTGGFSTRSARRTALGWLAILAALHGIGYGILASGTDGNRLKVAALQPGDDDPLPLLKQAKVQGAQVAVWPELALMEPLGKDLVKYHVPGLYQVIGHSGEIEVDQKPENFASLFSPDGTRLSRYAKIHLFGSETEVHRPGKELVVAPSPVGRAGLAICYDTMYTDVIRKLAQKGAQIAYVPNLDPNAGRSSLHAIHAAATVFRAAENGIPLVRSEYKAHSMIIDGQGRIVAEAGLQSPTVAVGDVMLPASPGTLYTRVGDIFPLFCLFMLIGLIALEIRETVHRKTDWQNVPFEPTPDPAPVA